MVLVKKSSLGKRRRNGNGRAKKRRVVGEGLPAGLVGVARIGGFYGRFAGPGAELKFLDTVRADATLALAGAVIDDSLNHIPQGNTESERIGRKVVIRGLRLKGRIKNSPTTAQTTTDQRYRIIVYCDKQANGATAVVTDILETAVIDSFRNLANVQRFQILYDKTKNMIMPAVAQTAAGTFTTYSCEYGQQFSMKLNLPIEFDNSATTGVITSIRSNNIGLLAMCSTNDNPPVFAYTVRIRYSDNG